MAAPRLKSAWSFLKQAYAQWSAHKASRLAASVACYTILSCAPLVILSVAVAGWAFGEQAARGEIAGQIAAVVGQDAGNAVQAIVLNSKSPSASGAIGTFVGLGILLFGASGVFAELQSALDAIWDVEPRPDRGFWGMIRARFFSFGMVMAVAFLLLASLIVSAALAAAGRFFAAYLPGGAVLSQAINFVVSLGIVTALFALVFKFVPEADVDWRDVWPGALLTAVLFDIGKFALALYIGRSSVTSPYGAAGSLVALVLWIYYASQIFFFGAECTRVHAERAGRCRRPKPHAVAVEPPVAGGRAAPNSRSVPQPG